MSKKSMKMNTRLKSSGFKYKAGRSVGVAGLVLAFSAMGIASPALADSTDTLVSNSVEGLREYQIFKHPGADLSYGEEFAPNFRATDIGITVVTEDQAEGRNLDLVAEKIQKEIPEYYDTIIVIQDSQRDSFAYYSEVYNIRDSFLDILGSETADAGVSLMDAQEEIFTTYEIRGGNIDEALLEAKVKKDRTFKKSDTDDSKTVQEVNPLEEPTTPNTVVSKSVAGLKSYRVFMHNETDLSESSEVSSKMLNLLIGVVVVKPEHMEGKNPSDVVRFIREGLADYHETVILVVDDEKDSFVVSSSVEGVEEKYSEILGEIVDDAGWALLFNSDKLIEEREVFIEARNSENRTEKSKQLWAFMEKASFVISPILILLMVVYGLSLFISSRNEKREKLKNSVEARIARNFKNISEKFQESLVSLDKVADLHEQAINTQSMSLSKDIRESIDMMQKLFTTVSEKDIPNVRKMEAEVVYASRIEKLVSLLGESYYVDMANDPYAWRSSGKGMKNVKLALEEFQAQILENIQQLNEDRELEFQVALSMLLNKNTVQLDEVYADGTTTDRASSYERLKTALRNRKYSA